MNEFIQKHQEEIEKAVEHFKSELGTLHTGRANPALVEGLQVENYGAMTPLKAVASISVPEVRVIRIEPWDKSILKAIEKAITNANLGFQGVVDGNIVRITMPQMTEESRQALVKILKEKYEKARVAVRSIRENIREEIVQAEKNKELTEDDKFDFFKKIDEEVEKLNKQLLEMTEKKEKEITTV